MIVICSHFYNLLLMFVNTVTKINVLSGIKLYDKHLKTMVSSSDLLHCKLLLSFQHKVHLPLHIHIL